MNRVGVSKSFRILLLSIFLVFTFRNNDKLCCHPGLKLVGLALSVAAHVGAVLGLSYLSEHNARPIQTIKHQPEKSKPNCTVIYDLQFAPTPQQYSAPVQNKSPQVKSKFEHITPPPFFQDCVNPDSSPSNNLYGDYPAPYSDPLCQDQKKASF